MKKSFAFRITLFVFSLLILNSCKDDKNEPGGGGGGTDKEFAGSGAEGSGAVATGGRGGSIVAVTSLGDGVPISAYAGTLRWALAQPSPKIIVFNVAGRIRLVQPLEITNGNITIMGQSAPGDGIVITDYPVKVKADNVIIRFMRFRMGDWSADNSNFIASDADAIEVRGRDRIMIDHCSFSWSMDECATFYDNTNFTLQYSFITESLKAAGHPKGNHGYGGIWGGRNATFYQNLLAHHDSRNPRFNGDRFVNSPAKPQIIINNEKVDYRNNVIYNWGGNSAYAGEGGYYNMINNYYKPGPDTKTKSAAVQMRILNPDSNPTNADSFNCSDSPLWCFLRAMNPAQSGLWGNFYINGNYMDGNGTVTADNWNGGVQPTLATSSTATAGSDSYLLQTRDLGLTIETALAQIRLSAAVAFDYDMPNFSAQEAYNRVLEKAGASFNRDAVDTRIVNEVKTGTGTIINSQEDVGGLMQTYTGTRETDSDRDGIPDAWETANGLNPNNSDDAKATTLDPPYMNIEVYLNDIVSHLY